MKRYIVNLRRQNKIKTLAFSLGVFFFFMSGTFYLMDDFKRFHLIALLTGIALIWIADGFVLFRMGKKEYGKGKILVSLYVFFSFSILLSLFANLESSIAITFLGLILIIWCCVILIPDYCSRHCVSLNSIYILLMVSFWGIFLYSTILYGVQTVNYEGAFRNQNSLGASATTLFCIASACFLDNFKRKEKNRAKILALSSSSMALSAVLALFATSRTSVIAIIVCFFVSLSILLIQGIDRKYSGQVVVLLSSVVIVLVFLYCFTSFKGVVDRFIYKFTLKQGDQLNGRGALWDIILNRVSLFGNGEDSAIAAHNTYLSLIDQYGVISGGIWILFCLFGLVVSFRFLVYSKTTGFKHLPLLSFLVFSAQSLTEGMMLKTIMLIVIFSISIIQENGRSLKEGVSVESNGFRR